jgi:hypothetical protein
MFHAHRLHHLWYGLLSVFFFKLNIVFFYFYQNLCTQINSVTSFWGGSSANSNVNVSFFNKTYVSPSTTTRDLTTEYYFQDSYSLTINDIPYNNGSIIDYCPNRYPLTRTQRYRTTCNTSDISQCYSQYQTWSGCPLRNSFQYSAINDTFFTARTSSIDDPTNFADFNNATSVPCMFF